MYNVVNNVHVGVRSNEVEMEGQTSNFNPSPPRLTLTPPPPPPRLTLIPSPPLRLTLTPTSQTDFNPLPTSHLASPGSIHDGDRLAVGHSEQLPVLGELDASRRGLQGQRLRHRATAGVPQTGHEEAEGGLERDVTTHTHYTTPPTHVISDSSQHEASIPGSLLQIAALMADFPPTSCWGSESNWARSKRRMVLSLQPERRYWLSCRDRCLLISYIHIVHKYMARWPLTPIGR